MEIIKLSRDKITDLDLPENVMEVYFLKNALDVVGYGFINYNSVNEIEIFIKEDYRGEEYGSELFSKLYDSFEGREIHLQVELSNYPMIRIVEGYNPLNIGTHDGLVSYVLKKD